MRKLCPVKYAIFSLDMSTENDLNKPKEIKKEEDAETKNPKEDKMKPVKEDKENDDKKKETEPEESKAEKFRSLCSSFQLFCYNPKEGSCLTRTPMEWVKILAFIVFIWGCIIAFTTMCWYLFMAIQHPNLEDIPVWRRWDTWVDPPIFIQPDLHAEHLPSACPLCVSVSINCIYNWKPVVSTFTAEKLDNLTTALKDMNSRPYLDTEVVHVTCRGKTE